MARILVIDDYPAMLAVMRIVLTSAGHEVSAAGDGAAGLQLAVSRPFDVALIDVDMPGMDGIALCEALKRGKETRHLPVFMMTGRPGRETDDRARRAGALEVIAKPFEAEALLARIASLVCPRANDPRLAEDVRF